MQEEFSPSCEKFSTAFNSFFICRQKGEEWTAEQVRKVCHYAISFSFTSLILGWGSNSVLCSAPHLLLELYLLRRGLIFAFNSLNLLSCRKTTISPKCLIEIWQTSTDVLFARCADVRGHFKTANQDIWLKTWSRWTKPKPHQPWNSGAEYKSILSNERNPGGRKQTKDSCVWKSVAPDDARRTTTIRRASAQTKPPCTIVQQWSTTTLSGSACKRYANI